MKTGKSVIGSMRYFPVSGSITGTFINDGYSKIPKKQGMTNIVPKIYQGVLFPIGVSILSLSMPTIGVIRPSANYPESTAPAPSALGSLTTLIK